MALILCAIVSGCSEPSAPSDNQDRQIAQLEIAAQRGDRSALRELDILYGMRGDSLNRERIYNIRLEQRDPEALDEFIQALLSQGERTADCNTKMRLNSRAKEEAVELAKAQGVADPSKDILVRAADQAIQETDCH